MPVHFQEVRLPASCRSVDFIADMHLNASHPQTFAVWQRYMQGTGADAIFILGDLFEVWMGDDVLTAPSPVGDFERQCVAVIAAAAQKASIYFMHGNRDLALRPHTLKAIGMQFLQDPTLLHWEEQSVVLTHGDLLCINDVKYQNYRKTVHNPTLQKLILMLPLKARLALGQKLRQKSASTHKGNLPAIMDVDDGEVTRWLADASCNFMIHGHTHRPADHVLAYGGKRMVLSDWDWDGAHGGHKRSEILRWDAQGFQRIALSCLGAG